jgi:phosphoserine phosphatase
MKTIITLVVNPEINSLTLPDVDRVINTLASMGLTSSETNWLSEGEAIDIYCDGSPASNPIGVIADLKETPKIDVFFQEEKARAKLIFLADMDSTIIGQECIDEIADLVGLKEKVSTITEAAMRGELDFNEALIERVALLKGLSVSKLDQIWEDRIRYNPGATTLIPTLKSKGIKTVLVSGGFTWFTNKVQKQLGFDKSVANTLGIENNQLTGTVEGKIINGDVKRDTLLTEAIKLGAGSAQAMAVGDGANDIPMITAAGFGVAYHAKPRTISSANAAITHTGLTSLLFALGIPKHDFISV